MIHREQYSPGPVFWFQAELPRKHYEKAKLAFATWRTPRR